MLSVIVVSLTKFYHFFQKNLPPKIKNEKNLDKMADNTFEKKCKKFSNFADFYHLIKQNSSKKETKFDLLEFFEVLTGFFNFSIFCDDLNIFRGG